MKALKDKLLQKRSSKAHHPKENVGVSGVSQTSRVRVKRGKQFGKKFFPYTKAE